ncbi:MAG: DUF3418 domain-containing protein, partial [Desertimonas sp.]
AEYLHYLRVREWQDLFSQLRQVAGQIGIRPSREAASPDVVHRAVLAGLLSHIGVRDGDRRDYRGARGSTFVIAPGSALARRPPRWVMAAELVETSHLFARRVAAIDPTWAEELAPDLVRRSYGEPHWDARAGRAVCGETVTLYGLAIVENRRVGFEGVDPLGAREMFIRHALVAGDWQSRHHFVRHNRRFADDVAALEARVRRGNLLDEDDLFAFFDERLPDDVTSARRFDRWWKDARPERPDALDLSIASLRDRSGALVRIEDYPDRWRAGDVTLSLTYLFEPSSPVDGVTAHVPLTALNQLTDPGFDWQIPGYRPDLVEALLRTQPKEVRRQLIPAADTADAVVGALPAPGGPFLDALSNTVHHITGVGVTARDFRPEAVPAWLRVNIVVEDDDGNVVDAGTDLAVIRTRQAVATREAIATAVPLSERRGITAWDASLGAIPRRTTAARPGHTVIGYPALLDGDASVSLRVLTNPDLAQRVMRGGVLRLLLLTARPPAKPVARSLDNAARLAVVAAGGDLDDLAAEATTAAVAWVLDDHALPWDRAAFEVIARDVRARGGSIATDALAAAADVLAAAGRVERLLDRLSASAAAATAADAADHLARLTRPGFVVRAGARRLPDLHRYVRGIEHRLERVSEDLGKDRRRIAEIQPLEERLARHLARTGHAAESNPGTDELQWMLEELRAQTFAQALGPHRSISPRRISQALDAL